MSLTNSSSTLNDITNRLLLKYDQNFQSNYNTSGLLNKGIMNKEQLIQQNLDSAYKKDKTINVLSTTVFLVIIYFILFTLNAMGKLQSRILMIISVFLFLIYLFYIYFYIIREPSDQLNKYSLAVGYELRKKFGELVGESMNYQCPTGCPAQEEEENENQPIQNLPIPVLDRQSSENVWLNGDRSVNNPYPDYNDYNAKPKPFFGGISKNGATYYQCEYGVPSDSPNFNGIPMNGKSKLFTTIPCKEMSGYKEKGKYICSAGNNETIDLNMDPNNSNFSTYLQSNCVKVV